MIDCKTIKLSHVNLYNNTITFIKNYKSAAKKYIIFLIYKIFINILTIVLKI